MSRRSHVATDVATLVVAVLVVAAARHPLGLVFAPAEFARLLSRFITAWPRG